MAGDITLDTVKKLAGSVDIIVVSSVLYAYLLDILQDRAILRGKKDEKD
nr:hypothetical protein [Sporomusa silvacetica]